MILSIVKFLVVAVAGFIAGVLVGRKNQNTVNTVVADVAPVVAKVEAEVKKI